MLQSGTHSVSEHAVEHVVWKPEDDDLGEWVFFSQLVLGDHMRSPVLVSSVTHGASSLALTMHLRVTWNTVVQGAHHLPLHPSPSSS